MTRNVLIIDDEEAICQAFRRFFERRDWQVRVSSTAARGVDLYREQRADVVFLDVRLPDANGLDVLEQLRELDGSARVVIITAHGSLDVVMRAVQNKAFDYLIKPLDLDQALEVAARAAATPPPAAAPASAVAAPAPIVGNSPAMQQVYKQMALVSQSDASVLITGATGTGKELTARAIHAYSPRRERPFVAINCGAIPENLVESELFGHVRGAFTGADADRAGRFEQANGGTLLLDEIGELPPAMQVKLLRVLDTQSIERVGSGKPVTLDVRVLAATNRRLEDEVSAGRFRADLYYRLAVMQVLLPVLCERPEDILPLARHFLAARARNGAAIALGDPAAAMLQHPWPGNVRELKNAVEHAAVLATGGVILPEHLPPAIRDSLGGPTASRLEQMIREYLSQLPPQTPGLYPLVVEAAERELFRHALRRCNGNQSEAADLLGVHRNTLRNRLRDLGIRIDS